jgi:uncharacterized protein (TIGR02453 family)
MAFSGWPAEAVAFYQGLQADNTRGYWTTHWHLYQHSVQAPMAELLVELAGEFGAGRISRPDRNRRFQPDAPPYKTAIYATTKSGAYLKFSAEGLTAGIGYYAMTPDQLDRYRRAVADQRSGAELEAIVQQLTGNDVEVGGWSLKRAPKGYPPDHPRIELLRRKGLIAWRDWPVAAWLHTAAAKQRVVWLLRTAAPLQDWLDTYVGPSQQSHTPPNAAPAH